MELCIRCSMNPAGRYGLCSDCGLLAHLLDDVEALVRRFVSFGSDHQSVCVALWVAHAYAIRAAVATLYLRVKSAAPESGKSTLLLLLKMLLRERAMLATSITPAALFRTRDKLGPVALLVDEADQTLRNRNDEGARDLLALLNSGYQESATVWRVVGKDFEPRPFKVFGPAAIAGIGHLPPTLESRSAPLLLPRAKRGSMERLISFLVEPEASELAERLGAWANAETIERLREARPDYPAELSDRQVEGWWALLAIADEAGGDWPTRARAAALALHTGTDNEPTLDSGILVLSHIRKAFDAAGTDRLATVDLLHRLVEDEEAPFGRWWGQEVERADNPRSAAAELASKLRLFGVRPATLRIGGATPRGYRLSDFEDAFARYLAPAAVLSDEEALANVLAVFPEAKVVEQ